MNDGADALAAVARFGIASSLPSPGIGRFTDAAARDLLDAIAHHRLTGVAVRAFEAGELELDDRAAALLAAAHDSVMASTLRVEATLLEVAGALEESGLDFRVLKGSALAHLVALDPADREFRDVDVLVRSQDIDAVVDVMVALGAHRIRPALSADFDRRFAKSVTMRLAGVEVDIHRTFAAGPFAVWSHPADLFVLPHYFAVADRSLPTLDTTDHLLHACYHVALGQALPSLTNVRDIALLAARDWDDERFSETVDRWRGRPVVARAARLVQRLLDHGLAEPLSAFTALPEAGDLLRPYDREGDRFPALALATLRVLPARDRLAFARAVAMPIGSDPRRRLHELWTARPRR